MRPHVVVLALVAAGAACSNSTEPAVSAPQNLTYQLEPSGNPDEPLGVLLTWDDVLDPALQVYRVYSRQSTSSQFGVRGETTSSSFDDRGVPDLEYFVVAVDDKGNESAESDHVVIDERLRLEQPASIAGTSLDGAVLLYWDDNAYLSEPSAFSLYRVYSTSYSLDTGVCGDTWSLEGTTVAPEFLASALVNGNSYCFAVSAQSVEGYESLWSDVWGDTPRPDVRNVVMAAFEANQSLSGFRFWLDANGDGQVGPLELGVVTDGSRTDIDFRVTRDASGNFFLDPVRAGTGVIQYSADPVADLTSIDWAPDTTYSQTPIQALPGYGYVFEMDGGDGYARYGAVRVTHVGTNWMIFDWSYQTDPGNPELSVGAGIKVARSAGMIVK